MRLKQRAQQGFTLIELMVVVAIIGILAAAAIPQYKNYVIKAKVGNALIATDAVKIAVALCILESGSTSDCSGNSKGIPADVATGNGTNEVDAITTTDGVITVVLASGIGTGVNGKKICLGPTLIGAHVVWSASTNISATDLASITETITKNNYGTGPNCT